MNRHFIEESTRFCVLNTSYRWLWWSAKFEKHLSRLLPISSSTIKTYIFLVIFFQVPIKELINDWLWWGDWFNIPLFQKRVFVCINRELLEAMLGLKERQHSRFCVILWGLYVSCRGGGEPFKHCSHHSLLRNSHRPLECISGWQHFLPLLLDL